MTSIKKAAKIAGIHVLAFTALSLILSFIFAKIILEEPYFWLFMSSVLSFLIAFVSKLID